MRMTATVAFLLFAGPIAAAEKAEQTEKPKSGIEKGGSVGPFQVLDVTGPNAGKTLCYV